MRNIAPMLCCAAILPLAPAWSQSPFFERPVRVLGQLPDPNQPGLSRSYAPNLAEGREFYSPQSVALDNSVTPPILYVADTANNRVLAWRDATAAGAAYADLVIGQPDLNSTRADYPSLRTGLDYPSALAVDPGGNLYVLDAGNHRILRFPKPFDPAASEMPRLPNAVIGQPDFNTQSPNSGGAVSARSLSYAGGQGILPGALVFDPNGNLYVTDGGNNRVLRYDSGALAAASGGQIEAAIVIGQENFTTGTGTNTFNLLNKFNNPTALAMAPDGFQTWLFVADRLNRVLAFRTGFTPSPSADRMIGTLQTVPPSGRSLLVPQGLAAIGSDLLVMDTFNNRILRFPPVSQWPSDAPAATAVIGQQFFSTNTAGTGAAGLTNPMHAAVSATDVYVADDGNNRIIVFPYAQAGISTTSSRVLGQLSPDYGGPNLIEGNTLFLSSNITAAGGRTVAGGSVAVNTRSNPPRLYIADTFNNRVLGYCDARNVRTGDNATLVIGQPDLFQSRANYTSGGTPDRGDSNLTAPMGLALDASGDLYVADFGNGRVLRFPNPCANPTAQQRANLVLGQRDFTSRETAAGARFMGEPYGIAIMPEGHIAVSDRAFNRVLLFKKIKDADFNSGQAADTVLGQGDFMSTAPGDTPDRMRDPRYIAVDSSGRLYAADYGNRRVLVFTEVGATPSGAAASLVVNRGLGTEALQNPHGIVVDPATGDVWVSALNDSRYPLYRYPEYVLLSFNGNASLRLSMVTPGLGLALDGNGNMFATEQGNRLSQYVPLAVVTDGGNFVRDRGLTPGIIATVWPGAARPFRGVQTDSFDWYDPAKIPLPRTLRDTQVLVNGRPAPLYYVSDAQINIQMPVGAPETGYAELQVLRQSTGEVLAAGLATMNKAQPAFLMRWSAPFSPGQVAALNSDGTSCNGPDGPPIPVFCPGGTRPARRGESIALYMTGYGAFAGAPGDGEQAPPDGSVQTPVKPLVVTSAGDTITAEWSGPAPGLIGVWQVNFKIPENAAPGPLYIGVSYRDAASTVPAGYVRPFVTVR